MIVVNKADSPTFPKEDSTMRPSRKSCVGPFQPAFTAGIYFVSSILGLGSKNSSEFISDNYAEKFEDQQRKYTD